MSRVAAITRGLAIFAAAWQLLWLVGDAGVRRIAAEDPGSPAVVLLAVSLLIWLLLWPAMFGRWRSPRRLHVLQVASMAFVLAAGFLLIVDATAVGTGGWFIGASILNLGTGLAGLYLERRTGLLVVIGVVIAEVVVVTAVHSRHTDAWPIAIDLVYPFYALALGLASVAARHALVGTARRQDASAQRLVEQQRARAEHESTDAAVIAAETRLHETVLNTLTAIVRGGLADDDATRERIRERAAESADVLRAITDGSEIAARWDGDLHTDLAGTIADVRSGGVHVELTGVLTRDDLGVPVEPAIFAAMGSAVREALINVARHAQASNVQVRGSVRMSRGRSWWRVEVSDDGRGFDATQRGYGLRSIIDDGVNALGGRVAIVSGNGTDVTIEVPLSDGTVTDPAAGDGPLRAIALPVVSAFTAFTLYTIGATWQYSTSPLVSALTTAVFLALVVIVVIAAGDGTHGRSAVMPSWAVIALVVGVPIMTNLERWTQAAPNPTGDWTSEAGSVLLFVTVATGPWWAFPAAAVSWFVAQELHLIELTQPGMFVIVVGALLGWQLRRATSRTRDIDVEVQNERAALVQSQQRLAAVHRRYQDVDTSGLVTLLESVADGSVDPRQEQVKTICLREERMIRSVMKLHPESVAVHRDLVLLAATARDTGIDLSITAIDDIPDDIHLTCRTDAVALLLAAGDGSQARASVSRDQRGYVFRLVVQVAPGARPSLPASVEILDESEGLVALEERCHESGAGGAASLIPLDAQRSRHG